MKYLIAVAFFAVASALNAPRVADDFAPIPLTNEAVRVADAPIYQAISRSELETIRIELPVAELPIAPVRVVESPVEEAAPVAETRDQVRVVEAPVAAPTEVRDQVMVAEAPLPVPNMPQINQPFYPKRYDNDMLR